MNSLFLEIWKEVDLDDTVKEDLTDAIEHGILMSKLAYLLSKELGMDKKFCYAMAEAGMLHDIGKLKLSKYLYGRQKNAMVVEEMKYVRMHPTLSFDILKKAGYPKLVLDAVMHHHENYDGTGYPDNLSGTAIPLGGRILRTCDVFAALISDRPYRSAFDIETTMELMIEEIKNFDMKIFLAFQRVLHSADFEEIYNFITNPTGIQDELYVAYQ